MNLEEYNMFQATGLFDGAGVCKTSWLRFKEPHRTAHGTDISGYPDAPFDNWKDMEAKIMEQLTCDIDPHNMVVIFPNSTTRGTGAFPAQPLMDHHDFILTYVTLFINVLDWLSTKNIVWKNGETLKKYGKDQVNYGYPGMIIIQDGVATLSYWSNPNKTEHTWPDMKWSWGAKEHYSTEGWWADLVHEGPVPDLPMFFEGTLVARIDREKKFKEHNIDLKPGDVINVTGKFQCGNPELEYPFYHKEYVSGICHVKDIVYVGAARDWMLTVQVEIGFGSNKRLSKEKYIPFEILSRGHNWHVCNDLKEAV